MEKVKQRAYLRFTLNDQWYTNLETRAGYRLISQQ